jgi:hypothetical protein
MLELILKVKKSKILLSLDIIKKAKRKRTKRNSKIIEIKKKILEFNISIWIKKQKFKIYPMMKFLDKKR